MNLESRRPEVYQHSFFPLYYFKAINNKRRREKKSYFLDVLSRQEEKTKKLLIKTRGTIQGCGGGAEKLVKIPYEKLKHGFKSSQKIVYRKVSKAELRPAQAWASSGSQGVEGLQFQEATPLPPTRAPSVHPGAETIQPERGR